MNPRQLKTAIITTNRSQAQAALAYQKLHPRESIIFIAADFSSMIFFDQHHLAYKPIFELIDKPKANHQLHKIPYQLTRRLLAHPQITRQLKLAHLDLTLPLTELLRFTLVYALEELYTLTQICQHLSCQKIIVGSGFVSGSNLQLFAQSHHLKIVHLDKWLTLSGRLQSQFTPKWLALLRTLTTNLIFIRHPGITIRAFLHSLSYLLSKPPPIKPGKSVLIFSNGLNLASYHSVITALAKKISVHTFTGRQSFLDRFFLAQYHLKALQLNQHLPGVVQKMQVLSRRSARLVKNLDLSIVDHLPIPPKLPLQPTVVRHLLKHTSLFLLKNWLPKFLLYYALADSIIERVRPNLVITTHDPGPTGLAFTLAAKQRHLPTAVLLHGSPSETHFFFADKQIIWGPLMKRLLISHGFKPNRLKIGGHPIYFDYQQYFNHHQPSTWPHLKLGILTSGFGPNEANQLEFFAQLFPQLAQLPSKPQILIRTHATQQLTGLSALAKKYHLKICVNPPLLLEEFVAKSNLIITQDSTAALVPLIAHKPTIALPLWPNFMDRGLVLNTSAFLKFKHLNQLKDKKFLIQLQSRQQKYLHQYCGPIDAKIGVRIAQKLLNMIQ